MKYQDWSELIKQKNEFKKKKREKALHICCFQLLKSSKNISFCCFWLRLNFELLSDILCRYESVVPAASRARGMTDLCCCVAVKVSKHAVKGGCLNDERTETQESVCVLFVICWMKKDQSKLKRDSFLKFSFFSADGE